MTTKILLSILILCYGTVTDVVVGIVIHLYTECLSCDNLSLVDRSIKESNF